MHGRFAFALLFVCAGGVGACGSTEPRAEPVTADVIGATEPPPPGPDSLADCRARPEPYDGCRWAIETVRSCAGPLPPPGTDDPRPVCACHECLEDAHCTDGPEGRCVSLPNTVNACDVHLRVCLYSGDPCYPSADVGCPPGTECGYDRGRRASCEPPPQLTP